MEAFFATAYFSKSWGHFWSSHSEYWRLFSKRRKYTCARHIKVRPVCRPPPKSYRQACSDTEDVFVTSISPATSMAP